MLILEKAQNISSPANVVSLIKAPKGSTSTLLFFNAFSELELFFEDLKGSKFNSLVVEETLSSRSSTPDFGDTPLELTTSGCVELSGEFL